MTFGSNTTIRYVATGAICEAVKGHEVAILSALGIQWTSTFRHIRCAYPNQDDKHPSWRWDSVIGAGKVRPVLVGGN